jgi:hypothetical protein
MKYMLLIYADEAKILNDKTREQRVSPAYAAYMEAMQKAGVIVGGDRLQPTASATTVRARNGKPQVLDGPYAETKEQLGGFFVLDVKDLDEAIEWAARIPGAQIGSVEIRPVLVFDDAGNVVEPANA